MKTPVPKPSKPAKALVPAKAQAASKKAVAPAKKPRPKPSPKVEKAAPAVVVEIDQDAATADDHDLMGLTMREARFIDLYLSTFKVGQSYEEAGYTVKNAAVAQACGSRLLGHAKSRKYLARQAKAMFTRLEEEQDRLMLTFTGVAYADPNELVEHRRGACRYCYGRMNRYQFTAGEWERALEAHETKREAGLAAKKPRDIGPLDTKGGVGYDRRREPHQDCPECGGIGHGEIVLKDTRNLSPAALALYAGAEIGKEGMKINVHNQAAARETLAKIRQLYDDKANVTVNLDMASATERFAKRMAEAQARQEAVFARRVADGLKGD